MTSLPPYILRKQQHKIGKAGRASETRLAKDLARQRPASGAMLGAKGDIAMGEVLLEAKSTLKESIGVKHEWLAKIANEARAEGKIPALSISFVTPVGKPWPDGDWVMIPMDVWKERLA